MSTRLSIFANPRLATLQLPPATSPILFDPHTALLPCAYEVDFVLTFPFTAMNSARALAARSSMVAFAASEACNLTTTDSQRMQSTFSGIVEA